MKSFHLIITSVEGAKFDGQAHSVNIPGTGGEMTILAGHEPLISTLRSGSIRVKTETESKEFEVERGVVECSGSRVTILV